MIPVILSGGSGTRLWPLSRPQYPKQFLALHSEYTLFQETLHRLDAIDLRPPIIVSNDEHRFIIAENLRHIGVGAARILLEPVGRNTAPAIAVAALSALEIEDDPILFVLPADHVIQDVEAFRTSARQAETLARSGHLVTFGIKPSIPHTGYGYIQAGEKIADETFKITAFKEKPDIATAQNFLKAGNYFWNSGMFVFRASRYLAELEKTDATIIEYAKQAIAKAKTDLDFHRLDMDSFKQCHDISIDYAVMEKTHDGAVVMMDAQWCDVGSWNSLWDVLSKDSNGNVTRGDVVTDTSYNNYIYAEDKLVATLGIHDLVVVDTQDALLIANRHEVENLKKIVSTLKEKERSEVEHHRTIYRPWGYYDSISSGERDQVKRITVHPGKKISTQKHERRAEHWIIVRGKAKVTRGDEVLMFKENESVYLPFGIVHALENAGDGPLEVIEVQTGVSFGDEDIIRLAP